MMIQIQIPTFLTSKPRLLFTTSFSPADWMEVYFWSLGNRAYRADWLKKIFPLLGIWDAPHMKKACFLLCMEDRRYCLVWEWICIFHQTHLCYNWEGMCGCWSISGHDWSLASIIQVSWAPESRHSRWLTSKTADYLIVSDEWRHFLSFYHI